MEYRFQATTNNIYRAQEYVIISDELVAGTITAVGSLKQFQLIKNTSFVRPTSKLLLTTFIVHEERVVISDGLVPGQCDSFLL